MYILDRVLLFFNDLSTLRVILCHLPEKGRKRAEKRAKIEKTKGKENDSRETAEIKTCPLPPPVASTAAPNPTTAMAILDKSRFIGGRRGSVDSKFADMLSLPNF